MPNADQFMLTLSEHQTIQPVLVGVYMNIALVLVMFVSNYVCTRLAAASDKVYQLLAHGRWFSPGSPILQLPPPIKLVVMT